MLKKSSCDRPRPVPIGIIVGVVMAVVAVVCIAVIIVFVVKAYKNKQATRSKTQITGTQQEPKKKEVEGSQEERQELKA